MHSPALFLSLSLLLWPGSVGAVFKDLGSFLGQVQQCKSQVAALDARICDAYKLGFCGPQKNLNGCSNIPVSPSQNMVDFNWGNDLNNANVQERGRTALADLQALRGRGEVCCGPSVVESCELPVGDALTARGLLNAQTARGAIHNNAEVASLQAEYLGRFSAGVAGECRGRKEACLFRADQMRTSLEAKASTVAGGCAACSEVVAQLKSESDRCEKLSEGAALAKVNESLKARLQAERVKPASKSSGSDSTLTSLLPMAMALLPSLLNASKSAEKPNLDSEPAIAEAECLENYAGGPCPTPGAAVATTDGWNKPGSGGGGESSLATASAGGAFPFANNSLGAGEGGGPAGGAPGTPSTSGVVPNASSPNPFGQGGGGAGASLSAQAAAGGAAGGSIGDKLLKDGERGGGGYSQQNLAMTAAPNGEGTFAGYPNEDSGGKKFDWGQFLPKGAKAPARHLAGGNMKNVQIQAKEVNIWSRISSHIKARCNQGLLRDCIP